MNIHTRLADIADELLDGQVRLDEALAEFEKILIRKALARHHSRHNRTAAALGIHRNTLARKVKDYDLEAEG